MDDSAYRWKTYSLRDQVYWGMSFVVIFLIVLVPGFLIFMSRLFAVLAASVAYSLALYYLYAAKGAISFSPDRKSLFVKGRHSYFGPVPIEEIESVYLCCGTSMAGVRATTYSVILKRALGDVKLESSYSYFHARRIAEDVAVFLKKGVIDTSFGGNKETRNWESLNALTIPPEILNSEIRKPEFFRSRVQESPSEIKITIPSPGLGLMELIFLILFLAVCSIPYLPVTWKSGPNTMRNILFVWLGIELVKHIPNWGTQKVKLNNDGFELRGYLLGLPMSSALKIPMSDIEEIVVRLAEGKTQKRWSLNFSDPTIMVRSDRQMAVFGRGLSTDEAHFLKSLMLRFLYHQQQRRSSFFSAWK